MPFPPLPHKHSTKSSVKDPSHQVCPLLLPKGLWNFWQVCRTISCKHERPGMFVFFFFLTFIHFWETERDRAQAGEEQREGDTDSKAGSRLWAVRTEPDAGLELMSCEIMIWAEVGHRLGGRLSHPGAPNNLFSLNTVGVPGWLSWLSSCPYFSNV